MEEVEHLPTDVKDELSHLSIVFIPGAWLLCIEVAEGHVDAEEVNGIADGRGAADSGAGFEDASKGRSFKETGVEEVPLKVGEREELFGRRHREPKTGDDPSFYTSQRRRLKEILLLPSGYRSGNGVGRAELRVSAKAFTSGVVPGPLGIGLVSPSGVLPLVR